MVNPAENQPKTSGLLGWSLGVDAAYEIICGTGCLLVSKPLAEAFGLKSPGFIRATGVGLIGAGLGIGWLASRKPVDRQAATILATLNGVSGAALLSLLGLKWLPVTSNGQIVAAMVGVDLAILAGLEYWGLQLSRK